MVSFKESAVLLPIITADDGDVAIFADLNKASVGLEAIDVIDGVYEIFDSRGLVLEATAENETSKVEINPATPHKVDSERLLKTLTDFATAAGILKNHQKSGVSIELLLEEIGWSD